MSAGLNAIAPAYPYQKRWLNDKSRCKAWKCTRSGGKTWTVALEPTIDCYEHDLENKRTNWFAFSGAAGQTVELIRQAAIHAQAIGSAFELGSEDLEIEQQKFTLHHIEFEHGSRFVGLPTNPLTIRGRHGHMIWDEAGKTPRDEEMWTAAGPVATRGFNLRVVGTPGAKRGPFFEMLTGIMPGWSLHSTDVHQAIAEGAPIKLEDVHAIAGYGRRFATEYLVEFEDDGARWIPLDLIFACEDAETLLAPFVRIDTELARDWKPLLDANALETAPSEGFDHPDAWKRFFAPLEGTKRRLFLGFDVARKRHLSVIWIVEVDGFFRRTRAVVAFKGRRFAEQKAALWAALEHCQRGCIDATGMGAPLAEETKEKFGEYRVEGIDFGLTIKEDLATRMLRSFEDRTQRVPPAAEIRDSIHSVYKITTASGHARFDADATEEAGHADFFWGNALSLLAAGDGGLLDVGAMQSFGRRRWSRASGVL